MSNRERTNLIIELAHKYLGCEFDYYTLSAMADEILAERQGQEHTPNRPKRISAIARHIWEKIDRSLSKKNPPQRRKFWLGYITALIKYCVITMSDYRWLRDKTVSTYGS